MSADAAVRPVVSTAENSNLPEPPSDEEKYWYLGRQHRWLLIAQALAFALVAYSVFRFSTSTPTLILFLIPTSLYGVTLLVSVLSGGRRKRISRTDHELRIATWRPDSYPTVDVFLPTAGEPLVVLENTYRHVAGLRWPASVEVYVLDDGARPEVRDLAAQYGFRYCSRPDRGHLKKAGNLRYGYDLSDGDVIAVLDADFVPRPDYLFELVPYFDEPEIGIVQSPQFFDAGKGMHWLQRCAGATQELFYRWIQPARDASNAAICVGTCALYRRSALEQSGGFAQIGHSEDVHTGVNLMRVGFLVRYVPVLVSKGICPSDLSSFLNQQYRWCTGSMSLLADKTFHANAHITLRQRLCFWAGFLYYISTAVNAFIAPLPGLLMLYFLPQWIEPVNSVWLLGSMALWFVVVPKMFRSRWRIDVLRVQYLYSFAHAVAIVHVVTGRTREWVATGAVARSTTPLGTQIARLIRGFVIVSLTLTWTGLVLATVRFGVSATWAMLALGVIAAYIQVPLLFLRTPRPARRAAPVQPLPAEDRVVPGPLVLVAPATGARHAAVAPSIPVDAAAAVTTRPQAPGPRVFRPDIQGLRAVAVLLVVLYHAGVPIVTGGFVGVDVFFVISGFLITGQLMREVARTGKVAFGSFWAARVRRLLPLAIVVIVSTVLVTRASGSLLRTASVAWDGLAASVFGLNYRLAVQGVDYQQSTGPASPLQHFWSLAVEEQFYLVWPVLILLATLALRKHRNAAVGILVIATFVGSLWCSLVLTADNAPLAYFATQTRAWELAAGAGVALLASQLARIPAVLSVPMTWIGLTALVASAFVYTDETRFPGTAALLPVVGACLLIAGGGSYRRGSAEAVLGMWPLQMTGKLSYGWYLWHWPVLLIVPVLVSRDFTWTEDLGLMAVALWMAALSYHLVESPSARSRWRRIAWARIGVGMSAASVAVALVVAFSVPALAGRGAAAHAVTFDKNDQSLLASTLGTALGGKDAPKNLTPTIEKASVDQPRSTYDGCHANYLQVQQGQCVYGDPKGSRTVVLFGDSHMQQWLPAFDVEAKKLGIKLVAWTKAACPIGQDVHVYSDVLKRGYSECSAWRTATIKRITTMQPDLIILSQSDNVPSNQLTNEAWSNDTALTAARLQSIGTPVIYMLDTPVMSQDAPSCIAAHLDNVPACAQSRKTPYSITGRHQAMIAALKSADIETIDPIDWLCTSTGCPVIVQDKLVYRDDAHLTATYSAWLAPFVAPLLKRS